MSTHKASINLILWGGIKILKIQLSLSIFLEAFHNSVEQISTYVAWTDILEICLGSIIILFS